MIPIENLVHDLVPKLTEKYPDASRFVYNTTRINELFNTYNSYVVGQLPPKGFHFNRDGVQLEALLEECLNLLEIKFRYSFFKIQVLNTSRQFKKFEILRGREIEVLNDKSLDTFEVHVARKYTQLLISASSRGLPFNLTLSDVRALLKRKTCAYTKVEFSTTVEAHKRTIDRMDCNLGYVKGNVVACTHESNQMKEHFFEHTGFDPAIVDKVFFAYYTLVAKGKIKPRKI